MRRNWTNSYLKFYPLDFHTICYKTLM